MNDKSLTWKALIGRLLVGAAIFVVANVIVYAVSPFFVQAREYEATVDGLLERPNAHILILGDSHVAQLRNAYLAGTAYNAAVGGDSFRECYAKLLYLSDRHPEIDTLILTVDAHMFGRGRVQSSNRGFADRYFLLAGSTVGLDQGSSTAIRQQIPLFNDDFLQYLRKAIMDRLGRMKPVKGTGMATEKSWADRTETERFKLAKSTGDMDHRGIAEHREPIEWFERIVKLARQRGIRIVAVRYPAHREYFASISDEQAAKLDRELQRMGITSILEFHDSFASPQYFKDPDHVSAEGAYKLLHLMQEQLGMKLLAGDSPPASPKS